jgi:LexA-binding, inner membrane-associated putative hydrolase
MFLGHYAVALAAKRVAPRTSIGTLIFAAQWLDELWPILLLAGVEHVRIVPGLMAANPLDFVSYPISHSLLMAVVWGAVIGGIYGAVRRYVTGAWVVGLAVVSHWVLDVVMHRPDLPLWPGSATRLGAGLWNSIAASTVVELLLLAIGLVIYLRATRARDWIGNWSLAAMVGLLFVIYIGGFFGPPPKNERSLALTALTLWVFVPWGYWIDRHRDVRIAAAGHDSIAPSHDRSTIKPSAPT